MDLIWQSSYRILLPFQWNFLLQVLENSNASWLRKANINLQGPSRNITITCFMLQVDFWEFLIFQWREDLWVFASSYSFLLHIFLFSWSCFYLLYTNAYIKQGNWSPIPTSRLVTKIVLLILSGDLGSF